MIVLKVEKNGLIGKLYHTQMGYNYKIFKGKKVVAIGYVYLFDKHLCLERMYNDLDNIDFNKTEKLK